MSANKQHRPISISSAIYRIQYSLIDSPSCSPSQLLDVESLLSQSDYQDVVTERSILGLCGSPLCPNPLPTNPARHTRFRISLPQHRVYDLEETAKYCSESCMVRSQAMLSGLKEKRVVGMNEAEVERVLRLFGNLEVEGEELRGEDELRIQEREDAGDGEVCLDEWIGPANAIEGYVPQRDGVMGFGSNLSHQHSTKRIEGTGEILSKKSFDVKPMIAKKGDASTAEKRSKPKKTTSTKSKVKSKKNLDDFGCSNVDLPSSVIVGIESDDQNALSFIGQDASKVLAKRLENVVLEEKKARKKVGISKLSRVKHHQKLEDATKEKVLSKEINGELIDVWFGKESDKTAFNISNYGELPKKNASSNEPIVTKLEDKIFSEKKTIAEEKLLKSCLKTSGSRIGDRSIKWADEIRKASVEDKMSILQESFEEHFDNSIRLASAEACAVALTQVAESTVSTKVEAEDAGSEAGILILPQSQSLHGERKGEDIFEIEQGIVKWPKKTVLLDTDMFEVEDSWHDTPPEGFSLNLSPFATMWMTLFGWITCSSLAYIYGHDESSYENFMFVNGKEYPRKVTMSNDQSLEIRKTLDSFICRTLPVVVKNLRLPLPVSTLEKFMGCLLNTMSFVDAIPSFKIRQWHVIILLFIEALSIHRLLVLAPHLMSRGTQLQQMLIAAQISDDEYETMRDLILPLGRSTAKNDE